MQNRHAYRCERRGTKWFYYGTALLLSCLLALSLSSEVSYAATTGNANNFMHSITYHHSPAKSKPKPHPKPKGEKVVQLQDIHMLDQNNGWALSYDGLHILHTAKGPQHWQDVTPAINVQNGRLSSGMYLDNDTAWIALNTNQSRFTILHTTNGGRNWQSTLLPVDGSGIGQTDFIDKMNGWVTVGQGAAAGSSGLQVLHSTDGGTTWHIVSTTDNNTDKYPGHIPFMGDKTGPSFINATTGWMTGSTPVSGYVLLFKTTDAGQTWNQQNIALPADYQDQVMTMPPTFFNDNDGYLPILLNAAKGSVIDIYSTHDGGLSWRGGDLVSNGLSVLTFSDISHGWDLDINKLFHVTIDGGVHWMQITPHAPIAFSSPYKLQFISPAVGYLLDSLDNGTRLFQTMDGGNNWIPINTLATS